MSRYALGDAYDPVCLQSVSKPLTYAMVLDELGPDVVHQYVGQEPSGQAFNTIGLDPKNRPHNPMVNAGAVVICSLLKQGMTLADKFDYNQQKLRQLAGNEFVSFNNSIFLSERQTADRNFAIGYYLKEKQKLNSMVSLFKFFLNILLVVAVAIGNDVPLCPLAEEGSRYTLNCAGQMPIKPYFVEWTITNSSTNSSMSLTLCEWTSSNCETNVKPGYNITNYASGDRMSSQLIISNVTPLHRDIIVTCFTWATAIDRKEVVLKCKMAVYNIARKTDCSVSVKPSGKIQLYCENLAVYPGIVCEFTEKIDGAASNYHLNMSHRREISQGNPPLLYKGSCEADIIPLRKGRYSYDVLIRLDYDLQQTPRNITTNVFLVDKKPEVKIEQRKPTDLCPNAAEAKVTCTASWFGTKPLFQFYINGQILKGTGHLVSDGQYWYTMTYTVPINRSLHLAMMMCVVGENDSQGRFLSLNDTKRLEFNFPPEPPAFRSLVASDLSPYFDVIKGENVTVRCEVDGGHPKVSSLNVTCMRGGRVNFTLATNSSNQVSFDVYGNESYQGLYCFCYPQHPTPCYGKGRENKTIFFIVKPRGHQRDKEKGEGANKLTPIYYIVTATLALILLPVIVATCLYIRRYGTGLYTYYYHSFVHYRKSSHRERPRSAPAPPLPPPRIPPRPGMAPCPPSNDHHHRCHESPARVAQVSDNDEDWMEDPDTVLSTEQHVGKVPHRRKRSVRKKRRRNKKVKVSDSVGSEDYLIPFARRQEDSSNQSESPPNKAPSGSEDYLTMHFRNGTDSLKMFTSIGFAPSNSPPIDSSAQLRAPNRVGGGEADLEKTGVKTADDTQVKRVSLRRHSPSRYVKFGGKSKPNQTDLASPSAGVKPGEARPASPPSSWVDTSLSDLDSSSVDESDILVDVANLDISADRRRHTNGEDTRGSGEFVPTLQVRAPKAQNIYVENSNIY
ncbi:hypothetical protein Btru_040836 [Bulinus truncatus]|nr:hypothetical protein Btru_040836 [Bulinus truncatus]